MQTTFHYSNLNKNDIRILIFISHGKTLVKDKDETGKQNNSVHVNIVIIKKGNGVYWDNLCLAVGRCKKSFISKRPFV